MDGWARRWVGPQLADSAAAPEPAGSPLAALSTAITPCTHCHRCREVNGTVDPITGEERPFPETLRSANLPLVPTLVCNAPQVYNGAVREPFMFCAGGGVCGLPALPACSERLPQPDAISLLKSCVGLCIALMAWCVQASSMAAPTRAAATQGVPWWIDAAAPTRQTTSRRGSSLGEQVGGSDDLSSCASVWWQLLKRTLPGIKHHTCSTDSGVSPYRCRRLRTAWLPWGVCPPGHLC